MERSIAQGPPTDARTSRPPEARRGPGGTVVVGLALAALLFAVYVGSNPQRPSYYNHFVWQAEAFLHGQVAIPFPVFDGPAGRGNSLFQDVVATTGPNGEATGYGLVPFPPLPAVVLVPFVAVWGMSTDAQLVAAAIGAVDVAIAFWCLGLLPIGRRVRIATTLFLGLGTVLWYAAQLGTTWYLAHVVAVGLTLLAIGVALSRDPAAAAGDADQTSSPTGDLSTRADDADVRADDAGARATKARRFGLDPGQVLAGVLLGLACCARLTMIFGLPFFVLVGGGGDRFRRAGSVIVGMSIPIGLLLAFTWVATGHLLHPGYEALYRAEMAFYPDLGYHSGWAIEDPRYLVQNLPLLVAGPPSIMPPCEEGAIRSLFSEVCPIVVPRGVGMGLFLTSPGWLLAFASLRWFGRDRLVTGAAIAVLAIAVVDLMHFSQGWVQFGYRFSNDFAPFALILLALALETGGRLRRVGYVLIGLSVAIVGWGVVWGHILGW